ncbi:hypothetical protein Aspvir_009599 [Aspergillus viridinutans]|uniref:Piwi-domain-containing protein n=1 Tax=Aspergillus viridinutans TaxID=75553 RepID=A0A9P3F4P7_ASPVI|nr:uncharacterized protein Aspvir_009599 [Aspergillus viridinutans]GIK05487.1 hypothetical protein Aspvir_009599 [Aspergillus viridinutans]
MDHAQKHDEPHLRTTASIRKEGFGLSHTARLPPRPGYGASGVPTVLRANYFELMLDPNLRLYRYNVEICPSENGMASRARPGPIPKRVMLSLLRTHFYQEQSNIATDGHQTLISSRRLDIPDQPLPVSSDTNNTYHLRVRYTGTLASDELVAQLTSGHREEGKVGQKLPGKDEFIQALNIIIGHYPRYASSQFVSVGSNRHFDINDRPISLGASLNVLRGLFVSVKVIDNRLLVNIQPKYVACYEAQPLDRLITTFLRDKGPDMGQLAVYLRGLRVQLLHLRSKMGGRRSLPRIKTIFGLAMPGDGRNMAYPPIVRRPGSGAQDVLFFRQNSSNSQPRIRSPMRRKNATSEGYTTVSEYFQEAHGIILRDPYLPVVNTGSKANPSYFPPEVCWVVPDQLSRTPLSRLHTRQLLRMIEGNSGKDGALRKNASWDSLHWQQGLTRKIERLLGPPDGVACLRSFGCSVNETMITVPARKLSAPAVHYGHGKEILTQAATWNLQGVQFLTPARVRCWTVMSIVSRKPTAKYDPRSIEPALAGFRDKLIALGIAGCPPHEPGVEVDMSALATYREGPTGPREQMHRFLRACGAQARQHEPKSFFMLVSLPEPDETLYSLIKYLCDVQYGIPNICVVGEKLIRANDQFLANLALKVNLKLGGCNHILKSLGTNLERTMVIGVDVSHPTQESSPSMRHSAPSVAAMVASVDGGSLSHWPAAVAVQESRQEIVTGIDRLLRSQLRLWQEHNNGNLPENILIYRDGVSKSQYKAVLDIEYSLLRKACDEIYCTGPGANPHYTQGCRPDRKPHISIVIVEKRHHTRFYLDQAGPRRQNPGNGTVIDRGVVDDGLWDFYLQSHTAARGTARPGHYVVIYDEIFRRYQDGDDKLSLVPDDLQTLTHSLCYGYGRATRVPSVVPPVVYADLVCSRVQCYLSYLRDQGQEAPDRIDLHPVVRDTMFYI